MFHSVSSAFFYVVFALALLATATPNVEKRWAVPTTTATTTKTVTVTAPATTATPAGSCNTGDLQCCNQVQSASSASSALLLGLLGIVLTDLTGQIGLGCSPLTVIGLGGGSGCSAHPVCCQNNNVGGLISVGCIPISL